MAAPTITGGGDLARLVGWINRLEWQTVFERLYSDDVILQQQAVDRISAWKSRFGDQIPVSIECTASLVRAQIMDTFGESSDAVQLAYSIAIIRFVNLITGREQTGMMRKSVSMLANRVGLPSWMVDLRHQAVHRFMPSTEVLREGAKHALAWLKLEYWETQSKKGHLEKEPEELDTDIKTKESVAAGLILYQQDQFQVMDDYQNQNKATGGCESSLADLEELLTSNQNSRHIIASILLLDGYLVPTQEQLESLHISKGYSEDSNKIPVLDPKFISFWTPLLRLLQSLQITPLLLASLVKELAKFAQPGNQTAVLLQGWAVLIAVEAGRGPITAPSPGSKRSRSPHRNSESTKTLYEGCKTIQLPWNDLVNICIENPNSYTLSVLPKMLWHMTPRPSVGTIKKITHLCSMLTHPLNDTGNAMLTHPQKDTGNIPDKESHVKSNESRKKSKWNKKNRAGGQSNTKTGASVDNGQQNADTQHASDVQTPPEQDTGKQVPSDGSPLEKDVDQPVENLQMSKAHSVEDLVSLVARRGNASQGLVGVSAQSRKDAKKLRGRKYNVWTEVKCKGIDWGAYPLGVLPGQPDDPDYLMLTIHGRRNRRPSDMLDDPIFEPNKKSTTNWKSPKYHHNETDQPSTHQRKSADQTQYEVQNREHCADEMPSSMERAILSGKSPDQVKQMESCSEDLMVDEETFEDGERTEQTMMEQGSSSLDVISLF